MHASDICQTLAAAFMVVVWADHHQAAYAVVTSHPLGYEYRTAPKYGAYTQLMGGGLEPRHLQAIEGFLAFTGPRFRAHGPRTAKRCFYVARHSAGAAAMALVDRTCARRSLVRRRPRAEAGCAYRWLVMHAAPALPAPAWSHATASRALPLMLRLADAVPAKAHS